MFSVTISFGSLRGHPGTRGPFLPLPLVSGSGHSRSLGGGWAHEENRLEAICPGNAQLFLPVCVIRGYFGVADGGYVPELVFVGGGRGCPGSGSGGSVPRVSLHVGRRGWGVASVCLPPPGKAEWRGCWGGAGPHSSQGSDVGRNRLSDSQTAVCSESLLIPGPGERLEPEGECLLPEDPGEVWRGTCWERLGVAGPGLSQHGQGPVFHPHRGPPSS